ncbi:MAG TPA: type II toxin-antitoxin system VapC family toxin [Thermoanaerobaculia bacterium]|jgi:tRNA(fMet)-specific endonuclease VapC|nr:type II toxin-antitoxin system VapC family toxin [Thermoanaerobaculia bacterium]
MKYLLDTNAWADFLNQRFPSVGERIVATDPEDLALSSIVLAELRYGADKSGRPQQNHARIDLLETQLPGLEFDEAAARAFGRLRVTLERPGKPIGAYDMLIAAQALSRHLILVSDNLQEFDRVPGLLTENWRAPV